MSKFFCPKKNGTDCKLQGCHITWLGLDFDATAGLLDFRPSFFFLFSLGSPTLLKALKTVHALTDRLRALVHFEFSK